MARFYGAAFGLLVEHRRRPRKAAPERTMSSRFLRAAFWFVVLLVLVVLVQASPLFVVDQPPDLQLPRQFLPRDTYP